MRRGFAYIIAVGVVLLLVGGAAEVSVRSATCMACHGREASFARWMAEKLKAEKKGFAHALIACADCHIQGGPADTPMSKLRGLLHAVTYMVPQIDPRRPEVTGIFNRTRIPTENCNYCHLAAVQRQTVYVKDLPGELKRIGLRMDHRKHAVARDDTCAKCHERFKKTGFPEADKEVNYAEVNHLACDSCHSQASHSYRADRILPMAEKEYVAAREAAWKKLAKNPRWMVAMPAEGTCRKCHNGKIHFKTRIFLANCREGTNFEDCAKCHQLMTKEYFRLYRKERVQAASTEMKRQDPSLRRFTTGEPYHQGPVEQRQGSAQQDRPFPESLTAHVPATR
ncbi:MAG: hypothetical protein V1792_00805 [Pseudomonadota bacterium]